MLAAILGLLVPLLNFIVSKLPNDHQQAISNAIKERNENAKIIAADFPGSKPE